MQTIIECLKQACTGELPPNTRNGQSFIHDPKACLHCSFCQFSTGTLQYKAAMSCITGCWGDRSQSTNQAAFQDSNQSTSCCHPYISSMEQICLLHSYTLKETTLISCCVDAAYTEEDCSSVQDAGPNPADLQQGHRTEAGLVLQMCRHRPHCPFAHGCLKGTAFFKT